MSQGAVRIDVKVIPRSRRAGIDGVRDGRLVVRVTAPPVDGAANDATIEALVPAARVERVQLELPGLTHGEGVLESSFAGYRPAVRAVPG